MRCAVFYFYPMEYVIRNQKTDVREQISEDRKQKADIEAVGGHPLEGE